MKPIKGPEGAGFQLVASLFEVITSNRIMGTSVRGNESTAAAVGTDRDGNRDRKKGNVELPGH